MLQYCLSVKDNTSWTINYAARAKARLAKILRTKHGDEQTALMLENEAQLIKREFDCHFLPFTAITGEESQEMVEYDHMIPIEGGRSTIGQLSSRNPLLTLQADLSHDGSALSGA